MVKLISWFGFAGSSKQAALKLLAVSAATGDDVHGYFASLALVTFYGFILLSALCSLPVSFTASLPPSRNLFVRPIPASLFSEENARLIT